jgi:hypothetical protein
MQKIQLYLLSNRIKLVVDQTSTTTEFNQVYTRKIKIYKGATNTIEFDIRNDDQRRVDVVNSTLAVAFYDTDHKKLFETTAESVAGKHGIMRAEIDSNTLQDLSPQPLRASALLNSGTNQRMTYADDQYGLLFEAELLDGYNDKQGQNDIIDVLRTFNYEFDKNMFVSEIGRFGTRLNDDAVINTEIGAVSTITVEYQGSFRGTIFVEATASMSTAFGSKWTRLEDWDITLDSQRNYTGAYRFVRFLYGGRPGTGATFNVTVANNEFSVSVVQRGQGYRAGDVLLVKGSSLGGDDGVNDLLITVNDTNEKPTGSIDSTKITWSGNAQGLSDRFSRNVKGNLADFTGTIDKIFIRN